MIAKIEPISAVIRVWGDGGMYGDPYEWVATVRWIKRDTVEILGYTKKVTPSIWKAIRQECQRHSITSVIAVTYVDGKRREKWIQVPVVSERAYE